MASYRIRFLVLLISFCFLQACHQPTPANDDELVVLEQNWPAAKRLADHRNKLILVDFYTTWCGPCKVFDGMLKEPEFTQKFAQAYVVLKYDAEKDDHLLVLKHHVTSYPTYILMTPDGQVIQKQYGRLDESDKSRKNFDTFLKQGVDLYAKKQFLEGISPQVKLDYPDFYRKSLHREEKHSAEQLDEYWTNHPRIENELDFAVLMALGGPDEIYHSIVLKRERFARAYGEADVYYAMETTCRNSFEKALKYEDSTWFELAEQLALDQLSSEDSKEYTETYQEAFWIKTKHWEYLVNKVDSLQRDSSLSKNDLNRYAWTIQEYCDESAVLDQASQWMDSLTAVDTSYVYLDTYAWVLYKRGRAKEALQVINRAIVQGESMGEDMSFSRELSNEIRTLWQEPM